MNANPLRRSRLVVLSVTLGCTPASEPPIETTNPPPITAPAPEVTLYAKGGRCYQEVEEHCPEGKKCNPPAPEQVDCPPVQAATLTVTEAACSLDVDWRCLPDTVCKPLKEQATPCPEGLWPASYRLHTTADGRCRAMVKTSCPEGVTCNPPPPRSIDCPPPLGGV